MTYNPQTIKVKSVMEFSDSVTPPVFCSVVQEIRKGNFTFRPNLQTNK